MALRSATDGDLDAVVALSSRVRDRLQELEPAFWRRHPDADRTQRAWFGVLLADDAHHVVVSTAPAGQVNGFVIARAIDAPPVYDPGGRTCLIDDLVWPDDATATELLAEAGRWARGQGCIQFVVVTPAADDERRRLLDRSGLHPASEWWTGPI